MKKPETVKGLPPNLATDKHETLEGAFYADYNHIDVPLVPVRMEIAAIQKDGFTSMPLGDFLRMIARVIKDAKKE